jgi:hypothetical protein
VVKKGDTVKIEAVTRLEGPGATHGLSISDMKIQEIVVNKAKVISFTTDTAGIFPISCHLHPPHEPARRSRVRSRHSVPWPHFRYGKHVDFTKKKLADRKPKELDALSR